jgi:hypothetical protein
MKKSLALVLFGLLLGAGSAWSFQKATKWSHYSDEVCGFSLDLPGFPMVDPGLSAYTAAFSAPQVGGFSNTVRLAVHRVKTSREQYRPVLRNDAKARGYKIRAERDLEISGRQAVDFECEAKDPQGRDLRYVTLVVIDRDRVIHITCTALADGFPKVEDEFRACLDSFKLSEVRNP